MPDKEDVVESYWRIFNKQPKYDQIFNSEVQLQYGYIILFVTINHQELGPYGVAEGTYNENPVLNSIIYMK